MTRLSGFAPAKVNLCLHVGPVQADGYHPLASLVAFADVGDVVTVEPAERLSLEVTGPFGAGLAAERDNLILKALRVLGKAAGIGEPGLRVVLDKQLPIAAGLGGGSSDAGAALRQARQVLGLDIDDAALETVAGTVGADGPMCLRARTAWAEGRGDLLTDEPRLPPLHAVLLNLGVPSSTGAVYRAFDAHPGGSAERPREPSGWSAAEVIAWLGQTRNDLQPAAVALTPAIQGALDAMEAQDGVGLTRMSGSGATIFGLFVKPADARVAAERLLATTGWWVRATALGSDLHA